MTSCTKKHEKIHFIWAIESLKWHLLLWMFPNSNRSHRIHGSWVAVACSESTRRSISVVHVAPYTIWSCCKCNQTFSHSIRSPIFPHSNIRKDLIMQSKTPSQPRHQNYVAEFAAYHERWLVKVVNAFYKLLTKT